MDCDLNLKATELRLGLPGSAHVISQAKNNKRSSPEFDGAAVSTDRESTPPPPKTKIVGWPPVRSCRKNNFSAKGAEAEAGSYVKVSMDGVPYLRKIDLKVYDGYLELLQALESMFKLTIGEYSEREGYKGSEYVPSYEDKDGDLMLVGDVPWEMFKSSCKRLRIMKGADARGIGCGV